MATVTVIELDVCAVALQVCMNRGDSSPFEVQLVDKETGAPLDITGFMFVMTVDLAPDPVDGANNLFQVIGSIVDLANAVVRFQPSEVQTDLEVGTYFHDMRWVDPSTARKTFARGKFKIDPAITNVA